MDLLKAKELSTDIYPKTFSTIRKKYPLDKSIEENDYRINERLGLASLLIIVSRNLRIYPFKTDTKKLELDEQLREEFDRVINRHVPFHFNPTEVTNFGLGPFQNETSLNRIQRINYIFHSIRSMAASSKWKAYNLSVKEKYNLFTKSVGIHPDWSPVWLRPQVDNQQEKESKEPPPKKFTMKFLREDETAAERAEMEPHISYLKEKGLRPPPEKSRLKIDPRYCVSQTQ